VSDAQNRHLPQPQHDFPSASSKPMGIPHKIAELDVAFKPSDLANLDFSTPQHHHILYMAT
jgi:hypothetical protein